MPIREELRSFYGREWRAYREALIALRGATCGDCGRDVPRYLNLAHLTHDPLTSSVQLLCPACHTRHDTAHRMAVARRNWSRKAGQLWLLDEIEWAAFPIWQMPDRVFAAIEARRQLELFG